MAQNITNLADWECETLRTDLDQCAVKNSEDAVRHYHDSGALKPSDFSRRHHTERFRASMTIERWTNAKSGFVGYLTGKGRTSVQIAAELGDGTIPATIRGMWRRWGLPMETARGRMIAAIEIWLTAHERGTLGERAAALHITPEEYLRRIAVCSVTDDLYAAITDGRFEKPTPSPAD